MNVPPKAVTNHISDPNSSMHSKGATAISGETKVTTDLVDLAFLTAKTVNFICKNLVATL